MTIKKITGYFFILLGLCAAALTAWVALSNMNAEPVLLRQSEAAGIRVNKMMNAFCAGDYQAAQSVLHGQTQLGVDRTPEDPVSALVWDTFCQSLSYELVGERYATDSGLAQDMVITAVDMKAITDYIEANTRIRLDEKVNARLESQQGLDEIYDENDEYRDEFVMGVVLETAKEAVATQTATVRTELTLHLVWENDQWWVVPSDQLLGAVSGGIVG